jgi:uncharacterized repeat protein (TIGR04076 family)
VHTVKITVLKRMVNQDLVDEFCEADVTLPCPVFTEGQEFILESEELPEGFCDSAWDDIYKSFQIIARGGSLPEWMKEDGTMIACCSDGLRPVVFEVRRIHD